MVSFHGILIQLSVVLVLAYCNSTHGGAAAQALHRCADRCGNLTIPYPFGMNKECYLDPEFLITCNVSNGKPPVAYLRKGNIEVTNISIHNGQIQVLQYAAYDCYPKEGHPYEESYFQPRLSLSDFTISAGNKFVAIGCDTYARIDGLRGKKQYTTGCISSCNELSDISTESCSGVGCCETSIPRGLTDISMTLKSYYNHTYVLNFNPCSYAFLAEESQFKFSNSSFYDIGNREKSGMLLDWTIGNLSCYEANKTSGKLVCQGNSTCVDSNTTSGYLCRCLPGYEGNPYHPNGCQDIDECKISNPCNSNGICINVPGNWTCTCPTGYIMTTQDGCTKPTKPTSGPSERNILLYFELGVGIGSVALLVSSLALYWGLKKRKLIKLKEKFFEQNGGLMLRQQLSSQCQSLETTKLFTAEELKKATNNYHQSRVLGEGGCGIVYKGILEDNKVVAIKKSKLGAQTQTEQFINEMIVLLQVNHRNVVKLLGCCLETEVPLLVYEFITNGTLFDHIHERRQASFLSWELRVRIAAETAIALAYLHSETCIPIIHRDVKTTNVLLDDNYTAKVSDFGVSRLIPQDQNQLTTLVQGTLGYLDPEYFLSSQLTEKSDVYSFGVILAELLTGQKVVSFDRPESDRNLAMFFISAMKDNRLLQVLDDNIVIEGNIEAINEVAKLATMCLRVKGVERPTMKEVAVVLEGLLRTMEKNSWKRTDLYSEENEYLLGVPSNSFGIEYRSNSTTASSGYGSMQNQLFMPYSDAR